VGKYNEKDQRLYLAATNYRLQGCLDSHGWLVCCLVLNPLFLVSELVSFM
jgi:hypothetical protein